MDDRKNSISPDALYARFGSEAVPIVVDLRRDADFASPEALVANAFHRSPDYVEQWRMDLPGRHQASPTAFTDVKLAKGVAAALRLMGKEAHLLETAS